MSDKNESSRLLVGKFSMSDNNCVLNIGAFVEVVKNYTDPLFFLSLDGTGANNTSISIKLNSIEFRALAHGITMVDSGIIDKHEKISGGRGVNSTLSVYNGENTKYLGIIKGVSKLQIAFKDYELLALSDEIVCLCNKTMDSVYKTQQFIETKKRAAKKKRLEEEALKKDALEKEELKKGDTNG